MSDSHWTEDADRIYGTYEDSRRYVGEDDNGDLRVHVQTYPEYGEDDPTERWEALALWKPVHLIRYWRSRRRGVLIWLERGPR